MIGRDARGIEDILQYLNQGAYSLRCPVNTTAIAAVDTASPRMADCNRRRMSGEKLSWG